MEKKLEFTDRVNIQIDKITKRDGKKYFRIAVEGGGCSGFQYNITFYDKIEKDYVKIGTGANVGGNLKKHIKALNKKMKESATNLEFEEAAKIRDEIRKLESTELEVTLNPKVKQYSLNNKIYPKGRSTMGMPGTRAQKGKKKWKQIKS